MPYAHHGPPCPSLLPPSPPRVQFKHVVVDGGADKPMPGADTAAFKNALADRVAHIKALAATRGCRISLKGSSDVGTPS